MITNNRSESLKNWLHKNLNTTEIQINPLAGDASFRRYFRVQYDDQIRIAMDAPPELEDSHSFVAIQAHLNTLNLQVPHLHAIDLAQGFILMDDLGDTWLWHKASNPLSNTLYQNAIDDLLVMQSHAAPTPLAVFDAAFMGQELAFFKQWFLQDYLQLSLSSAENDLLENIFSQLIQAALSQPYYFCHRDYHSRNLMVLNNAKMGILDFQDAVLGPLTYDLVSLLRDCYVTLSEADLQKHLQYYFEKAGMMGLFDTKDFNTFNQWFDWMGLQRHLKAIFIFARKQLRDNNPNFLRYLPRTLNYVHTISRPYEQLSDFHHFMEKRILPTFKEVYVI